ncbi:hypothetical protein V8G54_014334 [Vigna mungo]|uniref:Uncharacterized protein n=1 Tax=Vigna mungo TaxID=3915 RepID=A0AAQ3RVV0_VIGMU
MSSSVIKLGIGNNAEIVFFFRWSREVEIYEAFFETSGIIGSGGRRRYHVRSLMATQSLTRPKYLTTKGAFEDFTIVTRTFANASVTAQCAGRSKRLLATLALVLSANTSELDLFQ